MGERGDRSARGRTRARRAAGLAGATGATGATGGTDLARQSMPTFEEPRALHYEVRCPSCGVSFPPETRRCLHCGGRTVQPGAITERPFGRATPPGRLPGSRGQRPFEIDEAASEGGPGEELPDSRRGRALRIGTGTLWLALILLGSIYRACSGGGG